MMAKPILRLCFTVLKLNEARLFCPFRFQLIKAKLKQNLVTGGHNSQLFRDSNVLRASNIFRSAAGWKPQTFGVATTRSAPFSSQMIRAKLKQKMVTFNSNTLSLKIIYQIGTASKLTSQKVFKHVFTRVDF